MTSNEKREYFDIGVVVPLEQELIQFMDQFASTEDRSTDVVFCHVVDSGNPDIRVIVVQQQGMGKMHATNAANFLLGRYDLGLITCLGIAGSLNEDMRLGSVCYSGKVADVLDNNRVTDGEDEETSETEFSPTHYDTPEYFTQALGFMRTQPALRPQYLAWQSAREAVAHKIVTEEISAHGRKAERIGKPETMPGVIACGMVSKSEVYNKKLRKIDRALLAVETESGGVFAQARFHSNVPAITIRGISDYADNGKNRLEQSSKGAVRELAASNAASFLNLQINQNPYFAKALAGRQSADQGNLPLETKSMPFDVLVNSLEKIKRGIDEKLRELSPEYKLHDKGYRLPLPRVRRTPEVEGSKDVPVDVRGALKANDRIVFAFPRTYPDQSLPWVVASDLLTAEFDERQAVPVVIDGEDIRGKQSKFTNIVDLDLQALASHPGARMIFIVENMPFSSKHRVEAILDEIEQYPGAKCIFLSRGDDALIGESKFSTRSAATHYNSCSISFLEIAYFIQKNFDMTGGESEVVAKRLRDTFHQFRLDAHPTYFAGIPRETLSALLQANRRSELIQLAVDGFLTFIVAGDKADVNLGRSTRARFLRSLVVEMRLEKRNFDESGLIAFTQEFAQRHDFAIQPLAFIKGFDDQGIIHFEKGRVHISLPFIESYLLAVELAAKPLLADKYFVLSDDFDYSTFDIYSEIGASSDVIERVYCDLLNAMATLRENNPGPDVLLGEDILPANLKKRDSADRLRNRLTKAIEAVSQGVSNGQEKQDLIDLHERVREEASKQTDHLDDEQNEDWANRTAPLIRAAQAWTVATILLGAGAEHLEAKDKRRISTALVTGGAAIIDDWSILQKDIDFNALKTAITTDEALAEMPGSEDIDEKRRFVSGFVDIIEYNAMADPLRRIMSFLSEQARHRVLSPSVEAAEVDGIIENVLKGSWLLDIDPDRGRKPLREAMRKLPRATFFRTTMVSHYLARVYWAHWKREDRMTLLDAAEDILKPLEVDIDKAKLKRLIETDKVPEL